ncbi:MAG TPA: SPFH domain-containing protein [Candidatus Limnocylindria bacterium]|jgi:hypothetical protein|nr:SPFH domain-containing protein [Candidatus Limnocylindria bacterium]
MKSKAYLTAILVATSLVTGCKPVKILDMKEVKPNETAWAIPLDSSSPDGQVKFNSISFLDQKKVAAKRVMIDKVPRSVGRFWFGIEWIPAVRVITVDRSLVTREWTDSDKTGSTSKHDGVPVNTKDNIALTIGLTITASIDEEEASTYLYCHGEKPLAEVTDVNIRSYAVAELNRQVSAMTLVEFQQRQTEIYTKLFADTAAYYKTKGVTIQYLGNAEGWHFAHKEIQDSINRSFTAQQDNKTAEMEQAVQKNAEPDHDPEPGDGQPGQDSRGAGRGGFGQQAHVREGGGRIPEPAASGTARRARADEDGDHVGRKDAVEHPAIEFTAAAAVGSVSA